MKKAIMYIYDYVGSEAVNANYIRQIVSQYEDQGFDEFELHLNSMGGSVFEGIAIYNFLKTKKVDVYIDGIAASIASVVAMCGRNIYMYKSSMMMIHNPWLFEGGESEELRKQAEMLDQVKKAIIEAYTERTKISKAELENMMNQETWLTSGEALKRHFCDSIIKQNSTAKNYVAVYATAIDDEISKKNKGKKMTKEFLLKLGLPESATEAEVLARIAEIKAGQYELKNDIYVKKEEAPVTTTVQSKEPELKGNDELAASVKALSDQVNSIVNSSKDIQVTALIDSAVNDGKILPADRDIYLTAAKVDFNGTKTKLDAKAKNSAVPGTVAVNKEIGDEKPKTSGDKVKAAADFMKTAGRVPAAKAS